MGFKFFYLPEHRVFNYPARYYNKDLEKFDDINQEVKDKQEGKEYVVQDGDCIFFKFNVTK